LRFGSIRIPPIDAWKSNFVALMASNIARIIATFVSMPAILSAYGEDSLGLWVMLLSIFGMVAFLNTGVAFAVTNRVGGMNSAMDSYSRALKREYGAALLMGLSISCTISIVTVVSLQFVNLSSVFDTGSLDEGMTRRLLLIAIIGVSLGFVFYLPKYFLVGFNQGYKAYMAEGVAYLALAALIPAVAASHAPIEIVLTLYLFIPYLLVACYGRWILRSKNFSVRDISLVRLQDLRRMTGESSKLSVNQAAFAIISTSDFILIPALLSTRDLGDFGIAARLFGLPYLLVMIGMEAIWPRLRRAYAVEGTTNWIPTALPRILGAAVSTAFLGGAALVLSFDFLVNLWMGHQVSIPFGLVMGFYVWLIVICLCSAMGTMMQSFDKTNIMARCVVAMVVVKIALALWLIPNVGSVGAVLATAAAGLGCVVVPYSITLVKLLRQMRIVM
jgi:O-antigen/teichoic acid export membrane protein